jgi:hypothetical protein
MVGRQGMFCGCRDASDGFGDGRRGRQRERRRLKSEPGPPMTLGNAAAAYVRLIVWCKACGHRVEPTPPRWPGNMAREPAFSIGAIGSCARAAGASGRYGGHRDRAAITLQATSRPPTGAADQFAARALANVLRALAVSRAVARVAHQATSPECRAAAGCVATTDSDRRRSLDSEE